MRFRIELAAVVFGFVALNLLLAFAGIGLFVRMGPAIDRILLRNDVTIVAAEEMLEVLARIEGVAADTDQRQRVEAALERARNNITEDGEQEIVAGLSDRMGPALDGDAAAHRDVIGSLHDLIALNRQAMWKESRRAHLLGTAGAWVAAFVGLATLLTGLWLRSRLERRIIRPIQELGEVLAAAQGGDRFRRCVVGDGPDEIAATLRGVNRLLDARESDFPEESRGDG